MGHLANAGALIVQVLFGLAIGLFFFRFLMQGLRVDFRNPLSQFVYRATNPVLMPVQQALPVIRGWNLAALLVTFLLMLTETWLLYWLAGRALPVLALGVIALALLIEFAANALLWTVVLRAILSFVSPDPRSPFVQILNRISDPILKPFQRLIPPLGGLDLSPLFALLVLQLVRMLIAAPLIEFGIALTVGGN
ncbi:MAG: YggT family protein [Xanthomonadales bacterium]|nr:YggT family protein [Xanthomonadales bacterium]MBK7145913.1 YggT family protein [Xanthomonadales bacterium]MCC6562388.1 YggT family protein [Xanthomonadales bacterium]